MSITGLHAGNIELLGAVLRQPSCATDTYAHPGTCRSTYLDRQPIDFRKQANGLALIVAAEPGTQSVLGRPLRLHQPAAEQDQVPTVEDNGFTLLQGLRRKNSNGRDPTSLMSLTGEINWLLDGYDITLLRGHKTLHYDSVG